MRRWFWVGFAFIAVGAVAVCFFARFDPCDTVIERVIPSPDNGKALIVFRRDCGATVDFNTQVSVVPSGRKFSFDDYPPFFGISGKPALNVVWLSGNRVRIVIPRSEKIFRRAKESEGISVTYQ
jgi:hypothetical protein